MTQIKDLIGRHGVEQLNLFLINDVSENKVGHQYTNSLAQYLEKRYGRSAVKRKGRSVTVAFKMLDDMANGEGAFSGIKFYDLKPYFAQSPKAKPRKDGKGWYLVVPVGSPHKVSQLRQAYSRSLWDEISHMPMGKTANQGDIDRFRQVLGGQTNSPTGLLDYTWQSTSITKVPWGTKRSRYITFRTVSDRSDPNSWLIGRNQMNNAINEVAKNERQARTIARYIRQGIENALQEFNRGD